MTHSHPFILEATAIVESRTLIYAEDHEDANLALSERLGELMETLTAQAGLPDNKYVLYDFTTRPAMGYEVGGSASLQPGITVLDHCHDHDHEEEAA